MNRIAQIIISDEFQAPNENEGNRGVLINPSLGIVVPGVPTLYSFSITILLTGYKGIGINKFTVKILDQSESNPSKRLLFYQDITNAISEEQMTNYNTNLNFDMRNFRFRHEGLHKIEVTLNDEVISQEFAVCVQKEMWLMTTLTNITKLDSDKKNSETISPKISIFENSNDKTMNYHKTKHTEIGKYIAVGLIVLSFNCSSNNNSKVVSNDYLKKVIVNDCYGFTSVNQVAKITPKSLVNSKYLNFVVDNAEEYRDVNSEMITEIEKIQHIENGLFYAGMAMGLFILIAPLFSNISFQLSIPASLFGFSTLIPKLRRYVNGWRKRYKRSKRYAG